MAGKDVTVFMISQLRQKLDAIKFGEKYRRTGGKSLDFYTHQVPWLAQINKLTNEHRKQKRVYGVKIRVNFKRNKTAVPFREATFNILFNYGMDDLLSCAEYLSPEELGALYSGSRMSREEFVQAAQNDTKLQNKLYNAVERKWKDVEEKTRIVRKKRWVKER